MRNGVMVMARIALGKWFAAPIARRRLPSATGAGFRLRPRLAVRVIMGLAVLLASNTVIGQESTGQPSSQSVPSANGAASTECTGRLKEFISELDELFDKNPPSIEPFLGLLKKYFPLKSCDIPEALRICREAKHLSGIEESRDLYVVVFDTRKDARIGYNVQFGLLKKSGDSHLPFAITHK